MASNALSSGVASTKAPAWCKAPPWPPAVPPPPIKQAKFWVFADITDYTVSPTISYAASCFCTYDAVANYWKGYSSKDITIPRISVILTIHADRDTWDGQIAYSWPGSPGWGWEFWEEPFHPGRPYISDVAEEILFIMLLGIQRITTCVTREIPS